MISREMTKKAKKRMLDDFGQAARECGFGGVFVESAMPTPFDRVFAHHRVRLETYLRALKNTDKLGVSVAFADSPEFNAFATAAGTRHFIGVPYGTVLVLSDLFLRALAARDTLPAIGDPEDQPEQPKHRQLPLSAADLPISSENPLGLIVGPTDVVRERYADYLTNIALDFLFAHEYQHIEGGHLHWLMREGATALVEFSASTLSLDEAVARQSLELDADAAGTRWSLKITVDRSNDHWRVPSELRDLLSSDENRISAWLFATGMLFRLMDEAAGTPADHRRRSHPVSLIRQYFTLTAARHVLSRLPCVETFEVLMATAILDVDKASRAVVMQDSALDQSKVLPTDVPSHINNLVRHWPKLRSDIAPIAAAWGGSNAPDDYFEAVVSPPPELP